jgi:tetratricopeptide (TPR) repeat protein
VTQIGVDPKSKIKIIENFRKGMVLLKEDSYDQAEKNFRQITTTEKHNGLAFRFLGDALAAQHKYAEAVQAYSDSLQRLPDPEVSVQLAKAYNRIQKTADAERTLKDTIQKFPYYHEAVFELASFYSAQKRFDEALALLTSDLPEFRNQRGILFTQKGEPQKAIPELTAAIKTQPKATYWNNLAIAYQNLRNFQEAEGAYERALELNPTYEECEANLSFLLIQLNRWNEAFTHLSRITTRNPKLFRARLALGFVLENQGKKQDALNMYRQLLEDVPPEWPQRTQLENRIRALI